MADWYHILQVEKGATDAQIKSAYRKLAKEYHPDAHPGDKECELRFREITEAYTILSDSEKRKKYDEEQSHAAGRETEQSGRRTGAESGNGRVDIDFQNISRNFEHFFGFDPNTKEVTEGGKLKPDPKNPLDTTNLFEAFMGIKR